MGKTAGARILPVEQGWGQWRGTLVATVEMLSEAADGLVESYPWLGRQRKWPINAFSPMFFKVFLMLAFETKI